MATIVSSVISWALTQHDGRQTVSELHVDSFGVRHERLYLAAVGTDVAANLAAYAVQLLDDLVDDEIAINVSEVERIGSLASPTFTYSTAGQNLAALRAAYAIAVYQQAIMMGDYMSTLTDAQLQAAFHITAAQVPNLRANKLTPAANTAASIRAEQGI